MAYKIKLREAEADALDDDDRVLPSQGVAHCTEVGRRNLPSKTLDVSVALHALPEVHKSTMGIWDRSTLDCMLPEVVDQVGARRPLQDWDARYDLASEGIGGPKRLNRLKTDKREEKILVHYTAKNNPSVRVQVN